MTQGEEQKEGNIYCIPLRRAFVGRSTVRLVPLTLLIATFFASGGSWQGSYTRLAATSEQLSLRAVDDLVTICGP